jgi:hypothetical protein
MTMTSQSNRTWLVDRSTANTKLIRTAGRIALLLTVCSSLALVLVGGIAVHSGVLTGGAIEAPDATSNIDTVLTPAAFGQYAVAPAACAAWDDAASAALGTWAGSDVNPAQVQDAKFRLRRARRNCMAGWINLACGDYQAVVAGPLPRGDGRWHRLDASKACGTTIAGKN